MSKQEQSRKMNICAQKIRDLRSQKSLQIGSDFSQNDLAAALQLKGLDVTKNTIQCIESGNRAIRDYELKAIAEVFGITVDELINES